MKTIKRMLLGVLGLIVLAVGTVLISYGYWYQRQTSMLENGSQIAHTKLGEVEYAVVGEGVPYLSLHGTPGGYHQALIGRRVSPELYDEQRTIAVSRPGYHRTPLQSGPTFEAQADLFAALLDELDIDRVVVFASSGGGYAGLQFAMRHPERCIGLVMYAPALGHEALPPDSDDEYGLISDITSWTVSGPLLNTLAAGFMSEYDKSNPYHIDMTRRLVRSTIPSNRQTAGVENDLRQRAIPEVDDWAVERIQVPTLILHGDADENSDYRKSKDLASRMPQARLVTYEGGDHFMVITRADEIRAEVRKFVGEILEGSKDI